jgi:hypothetical protein
MLTAALAIGHQVAGKSVREGLFLSTYSVSDLPKAMLGSALAAIPIALLVARLMTRLGPARLAPPLFVSSALLTLAEWWLLPSFPRPIALLVYLHVSIGGALLMSAFWSIVNERFDPHTLKRLVGRIAASATLGGLVGGLAMERIAHLLNARSTLPLVAGMCLLAALSSRWLAQTLGPSGVTLNEAVRPPRFTGYLWTLALLVASSAAASAFADFGRPRHLRTSTRMPSASLSSCRRKAAGEASLAAARGRNRKAMAPWLSAASCRRRSAA